MIRLEHAAESHRRLMLDWRNQPEVSRWMYTDHLISEGEHDAWFDRMLENPAHHYWIVSWHSEPVGVVHLIGEPPGHRAEWGIYIASPTAKGTGAAAGAAFLSLDCAFRDIGVGRVTCEALAGNTRALALYERVGFRREGHLRGHVARGSEVLDVVCLGGLASDWTTLRPGLLGSLTDRGVLSTGVDS